MLFKRNNLVIILVVVAFICVQNLCFAQYPEKPIQINVPFGEGGSTDIAARSIEKFGEEYMGESMYVQNRPGAGGAIGLEFGKNAEPDGYTLTCAPTSLTAAPHVTEEFPATYKDFIPLVRIHTAALGLWVKEGTFETVDEFINAAKEDPRGLLVGHADIGSPAHFLLPGIESGFDIDVVGVPYFGGGPTLTALLGGHIDACISTTVEGLPHAEAGELKMLATVEHYPNLPDVPTFEELGFDVPKIMIWTGLFAPNGTPQDKVDYLIDKLKKITQDEDFISFWEEQGLVPENIFGNEFKKWLEDTHNNFGKLAKEIRPEL